MGGMSYQGHEWSITKPLGMLGIEVTSEKQIEDLQMDSNKNQRRRETQETGWQSEARGGSRQKLDQMVNATNPDGNSLDTTSQGGEMERKTQE